MLRVLLCEDEPVFTEQLTGLLDFSAEELGISLEVLSCSDTDALLHILETEKDIPLVLLDLHLEEASGMKLAQQLRASGYRGSIAFVTVDPSMVYDGYSVDASGYYLKPARPVDVKRILSGLQMKQENKRSVLITKGAVTRRVPVSRISFLEICGKQVAYHLPGECLSQTEKLDDVMETLPKEMFLRCHRSYAVNLAYVEKTERYLLTLRDGTELPVSKAYSQEVRQKVADYLAAKGKS